MHSKLVALSLLALAGCAGGPAGEVGEEAEAITGGQIDTADPAVVLLFGQVPGASGGSLCTGTLVSPTVVLTAAHCVGGEGGGDNLVYTVFFNNDFQVNPGNGKRAASVHYDPEFQVDHLGDGHDIGVAILAEPAAVTPASVNMQPIDPQMVNQAVRFVGYGLSDTTTKSGAGTKRTTTTTLSSYNQVLLNFTDGVHETCNGDSGGPAFMTIDGKEVVIGVTSFGDANCQLGGSDTRVDTMLPFLSSYLSGVSIEAEPPAPTVSGSGGCAVGGSPGADGLAALLLSLCALVLARRRYSPKR